MAVNTAVTIRPIGAADLDQVAGACWENRATQMRLLELQETLGMGAWEGTRCVGQLHCYRVSLPEYDNANFPGYGRERPVSWPLGWPLVVAQERRLRFGGPVWGHACFHVGFADPKARHADAAFFGKGIGRALCEASIRWAREHGYAAIVAQGGTKAIPAYNVWMGCLPWTTYASLGFEVAALEEDGKALPWWAREGGARPDVVAQVQPTLAAGTKVEDLCARLMVLRL